MRLISACFTRTNSPTDAIRIVARRPEHNGQVTAMPVKGFVETQHATPSPTGEYWACVWGGKLKCFFVPPPGA